MILRRLFPLCSLGPFNYFITIGVELIFVLQRCTYKTNSRKVKCYVGFGVGSNVGVIIVRVNTLCRKYLFLLRFLSILLLLPQVGFET